MNNPEFDSQKEIERWKGFFSIWTDPEPAVGPTPRTAVWKKNKAALWYYPSSNKKYKVPLFLVYSLVNKAYVLDMAPGASMIEAFVENGFDVYLLEFGSPAFEDQDITIDDYIIDYIQRAVRKALAHSGAEEITVIGYCVGGTLAAIYASIAQEPIRNLIICVAPIDFSDSPKFDQWVEYIRENDIDIENLMRLNGAIPPKLMKIGLRAASSPIYFSHYLSLLNKAYDKEYVASWRRFNKWTNDHVGFSEAAMLQLGNDIVKENKFMKNTLTIRGKKASPSNICANLLVVAGKHDRLVPDVLSKGLADVVSSKDKTYCPVTGGHTTMAVKGKGLPKFLADWLPERSN
ncbi:alpha/beta fold hydrolase [Bacillus salacetis]|uniref:Alpha/beta fold hydrolase n=1 Tax=Bacillus salacetis TaxID=2315464 RepID=A0A3A1QMH1_9BACI|nr:alpha/beta fold hydrolase [Bacillus salacetis]RIW28053.1 alpha/beta fold hydrolase [Bacillus salacetis]